MKRTLCCLAFGLACLLSGCSPGPQPSPSPATETTEVRESEETTEEKGPSEEAKPIELESDQQEKAGIVVTASKWGTMRETLTTTGALEYDPDLRSEVTSPLSGRVLELHASVGQRVQAGQVLATLQSPELSQAVLRYQNAALRAELANQEVARREQLARLGESNRPLEEAQEDEATARADLDSARAQLRLAKSQRDRVRGLKQDGITSGQQLEEAEATLATSQARVREAEQHLVIARRRTGRESKLGSDQTRLRQAVAEAVTEQATARAELEAAADQLSVLGATPGQGARLGLPALHDGLVLERPAVLGQAVQAGSDLFTLQDTGRLLARVDLSEEQLPDVRPGLRVHVRAKAFPQRTFSGRISFVSSQLDPKTRTARAFATVDNQAGNLKADMFVTVELELGATRQAVLIPETALVRTDEGQAVYVAIDPKTFQRQAVEIGGLEGGWREIKEGLKAGQKVVSRGSFSLQSEEQKDSLGEEEGE